MEVTKCKNCAANLPIEKEVICEYCGTKYKFKKESIFFRFFINLSLIDIINRFIR